jgi:hypothetical protein
MLDLFTGEGNGRSGSVAFSAGLSLDNRGREDVEHFVIGGAYDGTGTH